MVDYKLLVSGWSYYPRWKLIKGNDPFLSIEHLLDPIRGAVLYLELPETYGSFGQVEGTRRDSIFFDKFNYTSFINNQHESKELLLW